MVLEGGKYLIYLCHHLHWKLSSTFFFKANSSLPTLFVPLHQNASEGLSVPALDGFFPHFFFNPFQSGFYSHFAPKTALFKVFRDLCFANAIVSSLTSSHSIHEVLSPSWNPEFHLFAGQLHSILFSLFSPRPCFSVCLPGLPSLWSVNVGGSKGSLLSLLLSCLIL